MISYRDALWPEVEAKRLQWGDFTADTIHPNDRGHAAIAAFIVSLLQDALRHLPAQIGNSPPMPPARFTDLFASTHLVDAGQLTPVICDGWSYDPAGRCWKSDQPGSVIEFDVPGSLIDLLYARVSPKGGTVRVTVDDAPSVLCDAWFKGDWSGFCETDVVGRDLPRGSNRVSIELIDEKNSLSNGHEFRILGLGSAGN